MCPSLPVGFEKPMLTHAMLGEQNPYYARYVGITDSDLKAVRQITHLLYERSLLLYQTFRSRQLPHTSLPCELNPSTPISSTSQASARQNGLTVDNIHSGDRMILKGYNARYHQPVIYTNAHIEAHIEGYWKHTQTLSVCAEPKLISISLEKNAQISSVAVGEYWLEVESSQIRYCGIGKKLFLYQGENSQPSQRWDRHVGSEHYTSYNYYQSHLLISGWVSVFEYENREKIF